jgi:hypothetical protein
MKDQYGYLAKVGTVKKSFDMWNKGLVIGTFEIALGFVCKTDTLCLQLQDNYRQRLERNVEIL